MRKVILKQLWNQRWGNGWIIAQLSAIFIAAWFVIDPMYTLWYQSRMFDKGYDSKGVFTLYVIPNEDAILEEDGSAKDIEEGVVHIRMSEDMSALLERLKAYNGVKSVAPTNYRYVCGGSYSSYNFISVKDTLKTVCACYLDYYNGSDYFNVFRFTDAVSGRWDLIDAINYEPNGVVITKDVEELLFGEGEGKGREMKPTWESVKTYKVLGVVDNIIMVPGYQPVPTVFYMKPNFMGSEADKIDFGKNIERSRLRVAFRIADNENPTLFAERFNRELLPHLKTSTVIFTEFTSLESEYEGALYYEGIPSELFTRGAITLFFMINIMLAILATFWFRTRKRRGDIGIMMALGSTKQQIRDYFVKESIALFIISVVISLFVIIQVVSVKGLYTLYDWDEQLNPSFADAWAINNVFAHFIIVTLIVIILIGGTVIIGAMIPASRAAKTNPAEALKA